MTSTCLEPASQSRTGIEAELAAIGRRIADGESHLLSVLGPVAERLGDPELLDAAVSDLEARHVELMAEIYDIQNRLIAAGPVDGETLRRYFMLTRGIADATSRIVRIEAEISQGQQDDTFPISEENIQFLEEKLDRFSHALAQMVDEHGSEYADGDAASAANDRALAALREELDEVSRKLWYKAMDRQASKTGKRDGIIRSVIRRILDHPLGGAEWAAGDSEVAAALGPFAAANSDLPGLMRRRAEIEEALAP